MRPLQQFWGRRIVPADDASWVAPVRATWAAGRNPLLGRTQELTAGQTARQSPRGPTNDRPAARTRRQRHGLSYVNRLQSVRFSRDSYRRRAPTVEPT